MPDLPTAITRPRRRWSWLWLIPLLAVLGSAALFYVAWGERGIPLRVTFRQGHGLKAGDAVRFRGIDVGRVEEVRLTPTLDAIEARVHVDPSATDLVREGSRFWIVRPQIDLAGAYGLETLVGANYLSALPGSGPPQTQFVGLDEPRFVGLEDPPLRDTLEPGGLDIELHTTSKGNLRPGAPVTYREVVVGALLGVELSRDASAVAVQVYIKPQYTRLIREHTRFWKVGRARLDAGWLRGVTMELDSMEALLSGGIMLALPPSPGDPVGAGHRFSLADHPDPEWLGWTTYLDIAGPDALPRPQPLRAELAWTAHRFFVPYPQVRGGWLLPVEGGLLGPADLLRLPPGARSAHLTLGGAAFELDAATQGQEWTPDLALLPNPHLEAPWPSARCRTPQAPEVTLIIASGPDETRLVHADAYRVTEQGWAMVAPAGFSSQWHGAAVVAEGDGALIGVLLVEEEGVRVALYPAAAPPDDRTPDRPGQ